MPVFKNLAISVTEGLDREVRAAAEKESISASAIVRRALTRYFFGGNGTMHHEERDAAPHPRTLTDPPVSYSANNSDGVSVATHVGRKL